MESGTYTVLVTPFCENNGITEIDYKSLYRWINMQYRSGIKNLVLHGTTSECPTLTNMEKIMICDRIAFDLPSDYGWFNIYVGVGGNDTQECINFAKEIEHSCKGIMVTVPYYNKPPQRGIFAHFKAIADSVPKLPVIMYNVPGRTGLNMEPETMIEIIKACPNVIALKEANGDMKHCEKFVNLLKTTDRVLGDNFKLFSGDDMNIVEHCKLGASGVISVASNIIPKQINEIVKYCANKDYDKAQELLDIVSDFVKYLFVETNPIPIKEIMFLTKIYSTNILRLPLVSMDKDKSEILFKMHNKLIEELAK
jgi:4-hydroxy-tetrahydrodipicolinate synthase